MDERRHLVVALNRRLKNGGHKRRDLIALCVKLGLTVLALLGPAAERAAIETALNGRERVSGAHRRMRAVTAVLTARLFAREVNHGL
jgi:hypothetical protein